MLDIISKINGGYHIKNYDVVSYLKILMVEYHIKKL